MGIKLGKSIEFRRVKTSLPINVDLPSKPYRFIDGCEMKSFYVPTMVKLQRSTKRDEDQNHDPALADLRNAGSTSVTFLRDERYLIFGSICTDLDTYAIERRLYNQGISDHDNLSLVDLRLSRTHVLINRPVRDVCLSSSCEHLGFLIYNGYSRLHVCPCNPTPRLAGVQIFEERNLISHSTSCAFSPNGKWLAVGVCSDYFTMRSTSHLVIRQVGKHGSSNDINLTGELHYMRRRSPIGLLINLDFSPDSTLLAVGGSQNSMYLLCTKSWKLISVMGESADRFTSLWAVFHPLYAHEQLISCTGFGRLEKWEVIEPHNTNPVCHDFLDIFNESQTMVPCCPMFAPNGGMLAIGLSNGKVLIVDPNLFNTLWIIWPAFAHNDLQISTISASSLCFSKSCQYLAIGYSRDFVTVWSLPRSSFTLKHFCRVLIISVCPPNSIQKLPIPNSLKQYLLYTAGCSNL